MNGAADWARCRKRGLVRKRARAAIEGAAIYLRANVGRRLSPQYRYLIRVMFRPPQMPIAQPSTRIVAGPSSRRRPA
jgi:hypothetical protein